MGRFGDWSKGPDSAWESKTYNVSYSVKYSNGTVTSGKVQVRTTGGKEAVGQRIVRQLKRRDPRAAVTVRFIWEPGRTPSGLFLPGRLEWIDDEIEGKHKIAR